jgi:hypothetical protein
MKSVYKFIIIVLFIRRTLLTMFWFAIKKVVSTKLDQYLILIYCQYMICACANFLIHYTLLASKNNGDIRLSISCINTYIISLSFFFPFFPLSLSCALSLSLLNLHKLTLSLSPSSFINLFPSLLCSLSLSLSYAHPHAYSHSLTHTDSPPLFVCT